MANFTTTYYDKLGAVPTVHWLSYDPGIMRGVRIRASDLVIGQHKMDPDTFFLETGKSGFVLARLTGFERMEAEVFRAQLAAGDDLSGWKMRGRPPWRDAKREVFIWEKG